MTARGCVPAAARSDAQVCRVVVLPDPSYAGPLAQQVERLHVLSPRRGPADARTDLSWKPVVASITRGGRRLSVGLGIAG